MTQKFLTWYLSFLDWFLPRSVRDDPQELSRAQNLVNAGFCALFICPFYAGAYALMGDSKAAWELLFSGTGMLAAPFALRWSGNRRLAQELFIFSMYFNLAWMTYHFGGIVGFMPPWLMACPIVAMFLGGMRSSMAWLAIACLTIFSNYWLHTHGFVFPTPPAADLALLCLFSDTGLVLAIVLFVLMFEITKTEGFRLLETAMLQIKELAIRDELTGSYNRRQVLALAEDERERALRSGTPFSLCVLDVDFFKRVNDQYGHGGGDAVLKGFVRAVQDSIRATDTLGRYGGEEFLLILPSAAAKDSLALADRLRVAVEQQRFPEVSEALRVTVSIGIAQFDPQETVAQTIARADEALYAAKQGGRNRVMRYGIEFQPSPSAPAVGKKRDEQGSTDYGAGAEKLGLAARPGS